MQGSRVDGQAESLNRRLRALPSLQRLLETQDAGLLAGGHSRARLVTALRTALQDARDGVAAGFAAPDASALVRAAAGLLESCTPVGCPVINATGVALHTNLGRAPLAAEALAAVVAAVGYCNLEFDLETGTRGHRLAGVEPLLRSVTGCQAGVAVNNGAAALLLALGAHASGGEVVISRGELVEIGGGFRIPDVIRQCGATLVEVGTTNRTGLDDYAAAITPATRMILKVHQSNYRILGFTSATSVAELAPLARERSVVLVDDLGSGTLQDLVALGRSHERTVRDSLEAGADLVTFSGDKLLGGPQAGLAVGTEAAVAPLRRHPLMRALRLDKLVLAALEATLRLHLDPARAVACIPALRMLAQTEAVLQDRAERLLADLDGLDARIEATAGQAGGGSLATEVIPSRAVSLSAPCGAEALAHRLRTGTPAVVGRAAAGRLVLDMLAVADVELAALAGAVRHAVR